MSRPATWILSKAGLKVCCELTDAEYQALPQLTLVGLLSAGVKATRTIPVSLEEFIEIGDLGRSLLNKKRPPLYPELKEDP